MASSLSKSLDTEGVVAPSTPGMPRTGGAQLLPSDYHARWAALARYGLEHQHGQLCRLALMYSLGLRRGAAVEACKCTGRPRVWVAEGSRDHRSERISLFGDDTVRELLRMVEATRDYPRPNFPRAACGSAAVDVWCHSLASRKEYRGRTNFEAVADRFHEAKRVARPLPSR